MKKLIFFYILLLTLVLQANSQKVASYSLPSEIPYRWKDFGERIYLIIEKQAHYLLGNVHEWEQDKSLKLITESKIGEHWIRPNAGALVGFAFLYRFGVYDQDIIGVSREQLLKDNIIPMMHYLVRTHLTGDLNTSEGKRWGNGWQSTHWAYILAKGAWWIWNDLPTDVQEGIKKIIKFEAARFYDVEPPFQLKLDTKSEENGWNSQIFQAAMLLMPQEQDYQLWDNLLKKWVISAYVRPADLKSSTIVSEILLSTFKGANLFDDFTLENHGIVHPDYMGAFILTSQIGLDYAMQDKHIPEFVFFNNKGIYENLKWFTLIDGGLNYPSGQDWPIYSIPDWLFLHIHSSAFRNDPDAPELARRVLDSIEKMQRRNSAGNVYQDEENYFPSAQSDLIFYECISWLSLFYMNNSFDEFKDRMGVKLLEFGKIIINRTPKAIQSLSWGNNIMFQSVVNNYDRVFDSHMQNGIGYIILKGQDKALPVKLENNVKLKVKRKKFVAEFSVNHGYEITAYYTLKSYVNRMKVSEKLIANTDIKTQTIATSFYGILNNKDWIYEDGKRIIRNDTGKSYTFLSGQGKYESFSTNEINIDGYVLIRSDKKMNVSYLSETRIYRSRLTDQLVLNHLEGERTWIKGQIISKTDYEIKME
jgi:hypothetical protein